MSSEATIGDSMDRRRPVYGVDHGPIQYRERADRSFSAGSGRQDDYQAIGRQRARVRGRTFK
jgi:hypothetical protein